jgi:hypothetical protein
MSTIYIFNHFSFYSTNIYIVTNDNKTAVKDLTIWVKQNPEEILSQPIWHNGRIRAGGQPVFFSHWAKSGIFCINDLIKEAGL